MKKAAVSAKNEEVKILIEDGSVNVFFKKRIVNYKMVRILIVFIRLICMDFLMVLKLFILTMILCIL